MDSFKGATQEAQQAAKSAGESVAGMGGMRESVDGYKQKIGGEVVVNVDPDDPKSMLLWG
jgi:hypothetical protein